MVATPAAADDPFALTHQVGFDRMAAVDRSASAGSQMRVWAVTVGDQLVSKRTEINDDGWAEHVTGVDSGVDAIAVTQGSTQRQRVYLFTVGVVASVGSASLNVASAYGMVGDLAPVPVFAGVLQEVPGVSATPRDHIRPSHLGMDLLGYTGSTTSWANESAAAVDNFLCMATAIRRNAPPPWRVVMSDSWNNGVTFTDDYVMTPSTVPTDSMSDPLIVRDNAHFYHHAAIEVAVTGSATACTPSNTRRVVHRRGASAPAIAFMTAGAPDLHVLETARVDHEGLTITHEVDGPWAHVIWWNQDAGDIRYATISPANVVTSAIVSSTCLTAGQAGMFTDAAEDPFGFSFVGTSAPKLCRLAPGSIAGQVTLGSGPPATAPDILFGPLMTSGLGCGGGNGQSCYQTDEPFSFAPDPVTPVRIHAVYQANVGGKSRVYYLQHVMGSLMNWTLPVPVLASADPTKDYVDPSITVDGDGTLVVTYSEVTQGSLDGKAVVHASYSIDGGMTWTTLAGLATWYATDLPFHCSRSRHFLGEYRNGSRFGRRAFIPLPTSSGGRTTLQGAWFSRWSMRP